MLVFLLAAIPVATLGTADRELPISIEIFGAEPIQFSPGGSAWHDSSAVTIVDNGRVIVRTVTLPDVVGAVRVTAHVSVSPVPRDESDVHDKWDRAGDVRLAVNGLPDIEIVKFITAYGGATEYDADVSHLAALLRGPCTFKVFLDTWVSPAWTVSVALTYAPSTDTLVPVWCAPLAYVESATADLMASGGIRGDVEVPPGLSRVMLHYYVSGHCTDGRDADEFVSKDNVISVDGQVVYRYRPWRDDCQDFRHRNPYCRRWSDGSWSSDYARSGWCPGDLVYPQVLDLSDHFPSGPHRVRFVIEQVRPRDADGHYGYWRVSSHLVGYR